MAVARLPTNRIALIGPSVKYGAAEGDSVGCYKALEAFPVGYQIELVLDSGELKWQKVSSAVNVSPKAIALDRLWQNQDPPGSYAVGELVTAGWFAVGEVFNGWIDNGQDISFGEYLKPAGDGTFIADATPTAAAGLSKWQSLDGPGAVSELTQIRILVYA